MKTPEILLTLLLALTLGACAELNVVKPSEIERSAALPPADPTLPGLKRSDYPAQGLRPLAQFQINASQVHALEPPKDLWERIRRGFAMDDLDNALVHDREQWYRSRPDYLQRMAERGNRYLFYIVEELERRNMPSELALLPFVESAFNPQAVSSAKAAGMWQFMPATGKTFDLKQNMFRDERRDVLASTRAALDYLQKLYAMFNDWQLALAAYNWGEGSVARAIAKNQKAALGTSYSELKLPMETQFYVPKLQAIKNIIRAPDALNLPQIGNHPFFQTVDITRDIDVALAARLAEISLDDFKALNPSANKPVLLASGTPQILLPWDNAALFQANLEAFTGTRLASWTAWIAPTTLKAGDAAKRVGMSESELRAVNAIPPRMLIKAGSALLVRRHGSLDSDISGQVAENAQLALAPEILLKKIVVKAGKKDSVTTLSKRYRVTAQMIAQWNKIGRQASLKPGQSVVLYIPVKVVPVKRAGQPAGKTRTLRKPVRIAGK